MVACSIMMVIKMTDYVRRIVDDELDVLMPELSAISLEGPKGVGKTETALRRAETIYELDDPEQRTVIEAEPKQLTEGKEPILVDEWQRVPETWDIIRRAVDRRSDPGRFLLTGSASPTEKPTHSGAGRIVTLRLRPFSLSERQLDTPTISLDELLNKQATEIHGKTDVGLSDYVQEITSSGFPWVRDLSERARRAQISSYLHRIVDTDFEQLGQNVRKPEALRRWMRAYAAATSTTASYEKIRDAATSNQDNKPAKNTTRAYREKLEQLWIIENTPAWQPSYNEFSRLTQSEKHQLADPALAVELLGMDKDVLLAGQSPELKAPYGGRWLGRLFESLITQSVRTYAQATEANVHHFRTMGAQKEIDLVVQRRDKRVVLFEVKIGQKIDNEDVKHLKWIKDKIGDKIIDSAVINTGSHAYRRDDGIAVIPAVLLGP